MILKIQVFSGTVSHEFIISLVLLHLLNVHQLFGSASASLPIIRMQVGSLYFFLVVHIYWFVSLGQRRKF